MPRYSPGIIYPTPCPFIEAAMLNTRYNSPSLLSCIQTPALIVEAFILGLKARTLTPNSLNFRVYNFPPSDGSQLPPGAADIRAVVEAGDHR